MSCNVVKSAWGLNDRKMLNDRAKMVHRSTNGVFIDENHIKSVYGRNNLKKYLETNKFEQIYSKKGTTLNEGVQYPNISDSRTNIISNKSENTNEIRKFSLAGVDALTADNDARIKAYDLEQKGLNDRAKMVHRST